MPVHAEHRLLPISTVSCPCPLWCRPGGRRLGELRLRRDEAAAGSDERTNRPGDTPRQCDTIVRVECASAPVCVRVDWLTSPLLRLSLLLPAPLWWFATQWPHDHTSNRTTPTDQEEQQPAGARSSHQQAARSSRQLASSRPSEDSAPCPARRFRSTRTPVTAPPCRRSADRHTHVRLASPVVRGSAFSLAFDFLRALSSLTSGLGGPAGSHQSAVLRRPCEQDHKLGGPAAAAARLGDEDGQQPKEAVLRLPRDAVDHVE